MNFNRILSVLFIVALLMPCAFAQATGEIVSTKQGQVVNAYEGMGLSADEVRAIFKDEFAIAEGDFIKKMADNIVDFKQYGIQLLEAFRLNLRNFAVVMLSGVVALFAFIYGIMFYWRMKKEAKLFIRLDERLAVMEKSIVAMSDELNQRSVEQKPKLPPEKKKTFQKPLPKAESTKEKVLAMQEEQDKEDLENLEAFRKHIDERKKQEAEKPKKERKHWFRKKKVEVSKDVASLVASGEKEPQETEQ